MGGIVSPRPGGSTRGRKLCPGAGRHPPERRHLGGLLGVPAGIAAHRLLVDNAAVVTFPESMKDVWHMPQLAALALAGVAIAVLGALVPARSAARMTAAKVLRSE